MTLCAQNTPLLIGRAMITKSVNVWNIQAVVVWKSLEWADRTTVFEKLEGMSSNDVVLF